MRGQVHIKNMNGITTKDELEDMVLYTGPNGSGKSTRLKAIILALLGYLPDGPRQARDIMHYATAEKMHVAFELPFLRVDRQYEGNASSAKTRIDVGPDGHGFKNEEANDKEKQERILSELGGEPYALDLGAFTSMNQNQQRAFILALCADGDQGNPWDQIRDRLKDKGPDPETRAMAAFLKEAPGEEANIADALAAAVTYLRSRQSRLQADIKNAKGTARDMAKDRTELNTSATSIKEVKEEIGKIQKELEEVAAEKGRLETAGGANELLDGQIKTLTGQIAEKVKALKGPKDQEEAKKEHQALADREKELSKKIVELSDELEKMRAEMEELQAKEPDLREAWSQASQSIKTAQKRADLLGEGKCPVGLECPHPKEEFHDASAQAIKMIGYYSKRHNTKNEEWNNLKGEIAALGQKIKKAEDDRSQADNDLRQTERDAADIERDIERHTEIAQLKEQKAKLEEEADKGAVVTGAETLEAKEAGLREKLDQLNQDLEAKELQKANEIAFTRALDERSNMEEDLDTIKKAIKTLGPDGMQAAAAKRAVGPFKAAIDLTLNQFGLKSYVETERNNKPIFEMGLEHPDHGRRPWMILPTSYRAIMGVAIALAFFTLKASKKAILIVDDIEHLDHRNRLKFFEVVAKKVKEGTLDLFVGASTEPQKPGKYLRVEDLTPDPAG